MASINFCLLSLSPRNALKHNHQNYEAWEHRKPDFSHPRIAERVGYKSTPRALAQNKRWPGRNVRSSVYTGTDQSRVCTIAKRRIEPCGESGSMKKRIHWSGGGFILRLPGLTNHMSHCGIGYGEKKGDNDIIGETSYFATSAGLC